MDPKSLFVAIRNTTLFKKMHSRFPPYHIERKDLCQSIIFFTSEKCLSKNLWKFYIIYYGRGGITS